jgi:hypothetical protein
VLSHQDIPKHPCGKIRIRILQATYPPHAADIPSLPTGDYGLTAHRANVSSS